VKGFAYMTRCVELCSIIAFWSLTPVVSTNSCCLFVQLQWKAKTCAEEFLREHGSLTSEPEVSVPMNTDGPSSVEAKAQ
jgi:hypothetical protein